MDSLHKQSLPEEDECTQASTDSVSAKRISEFIETPQISRPCTIIAALPHATFLPVTPVCTAFGASKWTPEHLLRCTQHTQSAILLRPGCLIATEQTHWFDFFDKQMRLPPTDDPLRLYVLVNRRSCRLTNVWLDAYERRRTLSHPD